MPFELTTEEEKLFVLFLEDIDVFLIPLLSDRCLFIYNLSILLSVYTINVGLLFLICDGYRPAFF